MNDDQWRAAGCPTGAAYELAELGLSLADILVKYNATHLSTCPGYQQAYWRMRPEYRPDGYGPDRPCTCGLDELTGKVVYARERPLSPSARALIEHVNRRGADSQMSVGSDVPGGGAA